MNNRDQNHQYTSSMRYLSRSDWPYADLRVSVVGAQLMMITMIIVKMTRCTTR